MKRPIFLYFVVLLFLSGCYFWASNMKITGTISKENYLAYEDIVTIKGDDNEEYTVRFQLAVGGKGGYDPDLLKKLSLPGKRCIIETGPHGVVFKAILVLDSGPYEIPKVDK